jgi:hypothetical protein
VEQQRGHECALPSAAEWEDPAVALDLERSEDAELHAAA